MSQFYSSLMWTSGDRDGSGICGGVRFPHNTSSFPPSMNSICSCTHSLPQMPSVLLCWAPEAVQGAHAHLFIQQAHKRFTPGSRVKQLDF